VRLSNRLKWLGVVALACIVGGVGLYLAVFKGNTNSQKPIVSFLGFTNLSGKRLATFAMTNASSSPVALGVDCFQELVSGNWTRRALTNGSTVTPEAHAWLSSFMDWGGRDNLDSGEGFVFHAAAPITNGSWRIQFLIQERDARDGWRSMWKTIPSNSWAIPSDPKRPNRRFFGWRIFSGPRYTITTPEVPEFQ
jgi:hypothetical protein